MKDYASTWVHPDDRELVSKMTVNDYIRKELSENDSFYINYRCIENDTTKYLQLRIVNVGSKSKISQIVLGYRTHIRTVRAGKQYYTGRNLRLRSRTDDSKTHNRYYGRNHNRGKRGRQRQYF